MAKAVPKLATIGEVANVFKVPVLAKGCDQLRLLATPQKLNAWAMLDLSVDAWQAIAAADRREMAGVEQP